MKVAIIGSRYFTNSDLFNASLDAFIQDHCDENIELLSTGDCGPAVLAFDYAKEKNIELFEYIRTSGERHSISSRDQQILTDADCIMVFISNKNDPPKILNKSKLVRKPLYTFYDIN